MAEKNEYIFNFGNRFADNHRAVEIQNSNRRLYVGERNFYLGGRIGKIFCIDKKYAKK